ncbi:GNAT family N-acetyltransferase [Streptomyces albus subsp. chlorinus]|uniref:GNAT family N-acetyltransferase n=1 Tax=Streptomyces albus TaxID=1888 RepID=UPI0015712743|nr:GNAT family N-acetyltransferase [Streptomyces albus]NSC24979.1 GNAT family N-acetyltransferase [Streptomyces albus subsp. chlorinus]
MTRPTSAGQVTGGVRPAEPADVPAALDTLTRAFADYAFTRHVVAADDHESRVRRFQELFLTRIGLPYGRVWVADGGRAVAVWTTPERDPAPGFAEVGPLLEELAGDRAPAFESAERALAPYRPAEPAWFLGTVGVDPAAQGCGLGSAVIRAGLAEADQAGCPAFLETSAERNVRFYERLGFTVTAEVDLPDGGPRTWAMLRRPGGSGE